MEKDDLWVTAVEVAVLKRSDRQLLRAADGSSRALAVADEGCGTGMRS